MIPSILTINNNYGAQLTSVAYQIVKDYDLAKDIMQDSLIKMWKNKNKFDENKATLYTWMRNIVVRTSIDATRTKSFKTSREEMPKYSGLNQGFSKINTDRIDVEKYLSLIDFKYAFVLKEIYLKGFSDNQVSREYNMPLGTVKSRKKIALRKLNKIHKNEKYN